MRFPHWLKTLVGAAVLSVTAGPVMAQGPGAAGYGQPMYQPAYGSNDPGVLYPQGTPPQYQPYPAVSPYGMGNVAWDQTFRDDNGLWFERIMNTNREYYASLDVTYNKVKDPGDRNLGSPFAPLDPVTNGLRGTFIPTYNQAGNPGTTTGGTTTAGSTSPLGRSYVDRRVNPYPVLVTTTNPGGLATIANDLFPIRSLSTFTNYQSAGVQGRWGFFNEDGSGMSVNAFWSGPSKQGFQMGSDNINGVPITQSYIAAVDGEILFTRNGAIPLDTGHLQQFVGGANSLVNLGSNKYDVLFEYDVKTSVIGTDTNFYLPPISQKQAFKLRPFVGGRYMNINEQFHFRGIDSGFGYLVVAAGGAGGGGGGGGGGANGVATYRPDANSLLLNYDLVDATLTNNVRTNLAGPQVGLRYDFGDGDGFKMWGQSVAGLMANRENYHLTGNKIADVQDLILLGLDPLGTDTSFNKSRTLNHVSPLFEQSINADMKILERIPIIRRLPGIEDTVFRIGYTMTVVGGVARAGESTNWASWPINPSISPGRETWWTSRWNFGIEKRF